MSLLLQRVQYQGDVDRATKEVTALRKVNAEQALTLQRLAAERHDLEVCTTDGACACRGLALALCGVYCPRGGAISVCNDRHLGVVTQINLSRVLSKRGDLDALRHMVEDLVASPALMLTAGRSTTTRALSSPFADLDASASQSSLTCSTCSDSSSAPPPPLPSRDAAASVNGTPTFPRWHTRLRQAV